MDGHPSMESTTGVSLEASSVPSNSTRTPTPCEKTARELKRDQIRRERGYEKAIETTTMDIVLEPLAPKTERAYLVMLREWSLFLSDYEGSKDPTNVKTAKDFLNFFCKGRIGRIDPGGLMTDTSAYTLWKEFMGALGRWHSTTFPKTLQKTIENLIHRGGKEAPNLARVRRPKRNLTRDDFLECVIQLWQNDWHDFDHERYRVGLHLLLLLHCNTSARRAEYEQEWRYADICLAMVWLDTADQPQLIIDFQRTNAKGLQHWVSEQPQHMLYELVGLPFYCNSIAFFVAAALADDALRDYHSWDDICAIPRPRKQKHVIIEWNPEKRHWPVFPRSSRSGQLNRDRSSTSLTSTALVSLGHRAGFPDNVNLHAARREVLLQVDNYGYSCNERMRFAAHINADTYRRSYQTSMPLVDGQASYFHLPASNTELHGLRRSYGWRRNPFHQPKLKEAVRIAVREIPNDDVDTDRESCIVDHKKRQRVYDRQRQQRDLLLQEQNTVGPQLDDLTYESDFSQTRKLMPERDRLATNLFREGSLRDDVGRAVMKDLIALCRMDTPKTYCHGLNPSHLACSTCGMEGAKGKEPSWWSHLYRCRKRSIGRAGGFTEFCFLCFQWYDNQSSWQKHVRMHAQNPPLKCSMTVFRHNLVRPALCPACLGDGDFHQYINPTTWKRHLQDHVLHQELQVCPHPRCQENPATADKAEFLNHLADVHDIRFESKQRGKALSRADSSSIVNVPKAISFVHIDAHQYAENSTKVSHRVSSKKQRKGGVEDKEEPPYSPDAYEETDFAEQETSSSEPDLADSDHNDHDGPTSVLENPNGEANSTGQEDMCRNFGLALTLGHAEESSLRKLPSIAIIVPPVPDAWKDVPVVDVLDEDIGTAPATSELSKSKTFKRSSRGRPRGSRNRKSVRRERRLATLAKTRSSCTSGL